MNKALFLDRDGVINIDKAYLHRKEDFEFVEGIFELCRRFQEKGYLIVVVTNQSGIARGYYSEEAFRTLTEWMVDAFAKEGITITKVYHCPHHPDHSGACSCRKPEPGMLTQAIEEHDIDPAASVLVGDAERDIEAARAAGVMRSFFYDPDGKVPHSEATRIVRSLKEIA